MKPCAAPAIILSCLLIAYKKQVTNFRIPQAIFEPPTKDQLDELAVFEREVGPVPLALRVWIEMVGTVNFMGTYPRLSYYEPHNPVRFAIGGPQTEVVDLGGLMQQLTDTDAVPPHLMNMFSKMQGLIQQLGGQDVSGESPSDEPSDAIPESEQVMSDPLVVDLYEVSLDAHLEWREYAEDDEPFVATVAPDILHKANVSGGEALAIQLPNAAADALLLNTEWGRLTFVEYLRLSFEWAGFPGLKDYKNRDEPLLATLKDSLLPL